MINHYIGLNHEDEKNMHVNCWRILNTDNIHGHACKECMKKQWDILKEAFAVSSSKDEQKKGVIPDGLTV